MRELAASTRADPVARWSLVALGMVAVAACSGSSNDTPHEDPVPLESAPMATRPSTGTIEVRLVLGDPLVEKCVAQRPPVWRTAVFLEYVSPGLGWESLPAWSRDPVSYRPKVTERYSEEYAWDLPCGELMVRQLPIYYEPSILIVHPGDAVQLWFQGRKFLFEPAIIVQGKQLPFPGEGWVYSEPGSRPAINRDDFVTHTDEVFLPDPWLIRGYNGRDFDENFRPAYLPDDYIWEFPLIEVGGSGSIAFIDTHPVRPFYLLAAQNPFHALIQLSEERVVRLENVPPGLWWVRTFDDRIATERTPVRVLAGEVSVVDIVMRDIWDDYGWRGQPPIR